MLFITLMIKISFQAEYFKGFLLQLHRNVPLCGFINTKNAYMRSRKVMNIALSEPVNLC